MDCQVFYNGQLYLLRYVLIPIIIIDSLAAFAHLVTIFEKQDILEVLLIDQVGNFFEDGAQCVHHDKESQGRLDEVFADIKFTALYFDIDLPVAEILQLFECARNFQS